MWLLLVLGRLLKNDSRKGLALQTLERSLAICEVLNDKDARCQILYYTAYQLYHQGRVADALVAGERALAEAQAAGNRRYAGHAYTVLATTTVPSGDYDRTIQLYEKAWATYQSAGIEMDDFIQNQIASTHNQAGRFEIAIETLSTVWARLQHRRPSNNRAHLQTYMANAYAALGKADEARSWYQGAIRDLQTIGGPAHAAVALGNLGSLELNDGNLVEAEKHLRTSVLLLKDSRPIAAAVFQSHWASLLSKQQRVEFALQNLDEADAVLQQTNLQHYGLSLCRRGVIHLEQSQPEPAMEALEAARKVQATLTLNPEAHLCREIAGLAKQLEESGRTNMPEPSPK